MTEELRVAKEEWAEATRRLHKAIEEAFPKGTRVSAVMAYGKPPVTGRVTGYSGREVCFKNERTGKDRHFTATALDSYKVKIIGNP